MDLVSQCVVVGLLVLASAAVALTPVDWVRTTPTVAVGAHVYSPASNAIIFTDPESNPLLVSALAADTGNTMWTLPSAAFTVPSVLYGWPPQSPTHVIGWNGTGLYSFQAATGAAEWALSFANIPFLEQQFGQLPVLVNAEGFALSPYLASIIDPSIVWVLVPNSTTGGDNSIASGSNIGCQATS